MMNTYATQCDKLRSSPEGEATWIALMSRAHRVDQRELENECDPAGILDDGETLDAFLEAAPDHAFYKAVDGSGRATYFIQFAGFERFFTEGGRRPSSTTPTALEARLHTARSEADNLPPYNALVRDAAQHRRT